MEESCGPLEKWLFFMPPPLARAIQRALRVPLSVAARLAVDLVLVATQSRTAVLIDTCALSIARARALAEVCHGEDILLVVLAQQIFVVHRRAFATKWERDDTCVYVDPRHPRQKATRSPGTHAILACIYDACVQDTRSCMIVGRDVRAHSIAACGWLLDYPVVYTCATGATEVRSVPLTEAHWTDGWDTEALTVTDVSLLLVEVQLHSTSLPQPHPVLAYTVPTQMPDAHAIVAAANHRMLAHGAAGRWLEGLGLVEFRIHSSHVHMDRMAL